MNLPSLVFFDLDGTVIKGDHSISPATRASVMKLKSRGVTISAATGRPLFAAREAIDALGITGPSLFFSGSLIYDCEREEAIKIFPLDKIESKKALGILKRNGFNPELYTFTDYYVERIDNLTEIHIEYQKQEPVVVPSLEDIIDSQEVIKIVAVGDRNTRDLLNKVTKDFTSFSVACAGAAKHPELLFANLTSQCASRENGLSIILGLTQLTPENVGSFGDSPSDVPFLERVKYSVAMGNASREVQSRAREVTLSFEEEGVAHTIEKWLKTAPNPLPVR